MAAYYNEIDPYAAQWLRNLIKAGHIAPGDVDDRSIKDVRPDDLKGYEQCHFFAGIGGWSIALRLAGWSDDQRVWTGSCPCQPFSVAGKGKAQSDERHLWPAWFNLIKSVQPPVVFGEQVAGAIAHGWLDDAFDDLEGQGYETAACVLPACSVGAPHKRDRLWFVGHSELLGLSTAAQPGEPTEAGDNNTERQKPTSDFTGTSRSGSSETMADTNNKGSQGRNSAELSECSSKQFAGQSGAYVSDTSNAGAKGVCERKDLPGAGQWDVEPPLGRVANGIPARAHKLRAYGNAIVPQVAAEFIKATM
jgi:DNA (cytosine-5)-methyltransferase 1